MTLPDSARAALALEMAHAATALEALQTGVRLDRALSLAADRSWAVPLPPVSRGPVRDMATHATRTLGTTLALARSLNRQAPLPRLAALQCVALSQLIDPIRHPAVIVDQAVEAAKLCGLSIGAASFLNASLRRFLRERDARLDAARADPVARWNHPDWWIDQVRADHPDHWQGLLQAGSARPPLSLRVNRRRISVDGYRRALAEAGFASRLVGEQAVIVEPACDVGRLPGWDEGWVTVQDAGAQWAASLVPVREGDRVLDACAAPGGKTTHLLERYDCDVTALDLDDARLAAVSASLERLSLKARVIQGDASRPDLWWDGLPFDHILVDAPCSASGISRRVPDARWLRRRGDLATLSAAQLRILQGLWPLLRPGGTLLYVTCSIFRAEGPEVVQRFLQSAADGQVGPISGDRLAGLDAEPVGPHADLGIMLRCASQSDRDHDGFYYCLIGKHA